MNDWGKNGVLGKWQGFEQLWQGLAQVKKIRVQFHSSFTV
jgi:hypothetical protein